MAKFVTPEVLNTYGQEIKNYIDAHSGLPIRILTSDEYAKTAGILNTLYSEFPDTTFYFETMVTTIGIKACMGILTINKRTSNNTYTIAGFCRTGVITGANGGFATIYKSGITQADMDKLVMIKVVNTVSVNDYTRPLMPRFDTQISPDATCCLPVSIPSSSGSTNYQTRPSTVAFDAASAGAFLSKAGNWSTPTFNYNIPSWYEPIAANATDGSIRWENLYGRYYFNAQNIIDCMLTYHITMDFAVSMGNAYLTYTVEEDTTNNTIIMTNTNTKDVIFEYDVKNTSFITNNIQSNYFNMVVSTDNILEKSSTEAGRPQSACKFIDFRHVKINGGTISTNIATGETDFGPALLFALQQGGGTKLYRHTVGYNDGGILDGDLVYLVLINTDPTPITMFTNSLFRNAVSIRGYKDIGNNYGPLIVVEGNCADDQLYVSYAGTSSGYSIWSKYNEAAIAVPDVVEEL